MVPSIRDPRLALAILLVALIATLGCQNSSSTSGGVAGAEDDAPLIVDDPNLELVSVNLTGLT